LSTFASGEIENFGVFVALRVAFGIFTSSCNPPALSLLRDYFPKNYRSTVNSVFLFGVYLGGCLSSLSVLFIKEYGWRADYEITGLVGLVSAIIILLFLEEPKRG
jgi:MFS family permease